MESLHISCHSFARIVEIVGDQKPPSDFLDLLNETPLTAGKF